MESNRKIFLFLWVLLVTLLLRDVPYLNVLFINQLWIVYLLMLFIFIFSNVTIYLRHVFITALLFFAFALVLSLFKFVFLAESVGILVYLFFWIILTLVLRDIKNESH